MTPNEIFDWSMKNYLIVIIIVVFLIILTYVIDRRMSKNRIKYALKFGKMEHFSGRFLGVLILLTIVLEYFKLYEITFYLLIFDFCIWMLYLFSHTFEKKLYPRNFRF